MLGNGCVWKDKCFVKKDGYIKKNYCDSDSNWRQCPHRPANDGNQQIQKEYNRRKESESNLKIWQIVLVAVIIMAVVQFLGIW